MNPTVTKVLAGLVLFASGVVVGVFGTRFVAERGRVALLHGDPRHFSEMIQRRLAEDLDLSKEQREKLRPIVLQTAERMTEIRREQEPKVREAIEKSITDIKAILTPEQQEKFTAVMARLEQRRKAMERFGPPPPPPGMGGFPPPPPGMGPPPEFEDYPPPPPGPGMRPRRAPDAGTPAGPGQRSGPSDAGQPPASDEK